MVSFTYYGRKFGIPLMLIIPLIIILLFALGGFNPESQYTDLIVILWIFLFLNSLTVSISGYSLSSNFNKEVKRLGEKGFPIESTVGFENMNSKIRNVFASAFFISLIVFLSLITFISILWYNELVGGLKQISNPDLFKNENGIKILIMIVALGMIFIAIGISLLITLPDAPTLVPGSLIKYYDPISIPSQLDNIISDSVFPFLDPITRYRWDEFSEFILANLNPNFEPNEDKKTKLEIAREKILLFAYLNYSMPVRVSMENSRSELGEIFSSEQAIDDLMKGKYSGITWEILIDIIKKIDKKAPEVFQIVDRLIVQLSENLKSFKQQDLFVSVTHPSTVSGSRDPFRIFVFMLNMSKKYIDKKRPVTINLITDQSGKFPDSYELLLDEAEINISSDQLPYIGGNEDIIGILSRILQVGDAVWFTQYRRQLGTHIFNVRVSEQNKGSIFGIACEIRLVRDLRYLISTYGGKISAVGGAILPIIGFIGLR